MESLSCSACGAQLSVNTLDRRLVVVSCTHCGGEFEQSHGGERRAPVPKPEGIIEHRGTDELTLQLRTRYDIATIGFLALTFTGCLVLMKPLVGSGQQSTSLGMVIVVFIAIGFFLILSSLVLIVIGGVINRTTVKLTNRSLSVSHRPIPFPRNKEFSTSSIDQLFVSAKMQQKSKDRKLTWFALNLVDQTRSVRQLSVGGIKLAEALYIEQEIEIALRLADRAVSGEYRQSAKML